MVPIILYNIYYENEVYKTNVPFYFNIFIFFSIFSYRFYEYYYNIIKTNSYYHNKIKSKRRIPSFNVHFLHFRWL